MKKLKTSAADCQMGINLGGHQLILGGGGRSSSSNFNNRQHQLIPPRTSSYNVNIPPAPPLPAQTNSQIPSSIPFQPPVPLPPNLPLPPTNLPAPPLVNLPVNLPPPPVLPLPPGPMPLIPPVMNNFNTAAQQQIPSFHVPQQNQNSYDSMPPPPPTYNSICSSQPSFDRFGGQTQSFNDYPDFTHIPKIKRSNSLDSLRDFHSYSNKRHKKSPAWSDKSEKRRSRSRRSDSSRRVSAEGSNAQDLEFVRLKSKAESLSVTFEPEHYSTPRTGNDEGGDESPVVLVATPEWKFPDSEPDSGLDSESDNELEIKDFPFQIVRGKELYPKSRVPFIDTHCHLDYMYVKEGHYTSFRSYIHKKDFPVNFSGCITCFCDPPAIKDKNYYYDVLSEEGVWGTFGLHPHNAAWFTEDLLDLMKSANSHPKSVAWGEIGLDYTSKTTDETKHVQQRAFVAQLKAAVEMGKPVVIHGRCAHEDTFNHLKQYVPADHKIHYHCFTASLSFAERLMDFFPNLFIGITGLLTYKNAELEKIVQEFPFERILVETDSPYMRPSYKNFLDRDSPRVTTPGMGVVVAQKIADVKGLEIDDVLIQMRENVKDLYGI